MASTVSTEERKRLAALAALQILDTDPEQEFDAIVKLASEVCDTPIALVSLVDESRQWFKARVGLEATQTSRDVSFCTHALDQQDTMVVPSAADDSRFVNNPLRTGEPRVEFYAGVPLRLASGDAVGTLCVIDHHPRTLTPRQQAALESLAQQVVRLLELRRNAIAHRNMITSLQATESALRTGQATGEAADERRGSLTAGGLALLLALISAFASWSVHSRVQASGDARLERAAERVRDFLEQRARAYGQILRGAGALFRASETVTALEFKAYADALDVKRNYPGLLGLGFAERVQRGDLDQWLTTMRAVTPDLQLVTSGAAPELVINKLVEPLLINRPALGYDIASEPNRAAALQASLRSDDLALSGRVVLRQDQRGGPGFLLYLAVPSRDPTKPAVGWVFAALRARDLVEGAAAAAGADVRLRFRDDPHAAPLLGDHASAEGSSQVTDVRIADKGFRLETWEGPQFYSASERTQPWAILVLGLIAALLSFALVTSMQRTEARSHALALRMTEALRRGEQELRAANHALERLATTDALTGLANRGAFDRHLQEELARARRNCTPLSLVLIDVDCFKLYNDSYGHPQGDECLRQVSAMVRSCARRAGEMAARYGGEEMALILPGSELEKARQTAEQARERVNALGLRHERSPHGVVSVSMGVVCYTGEGPLEPKQVIAAADAALYRAKENGRNRVEVAASAT